MEEEGCLIGVLFRCLFEAIKSVRRLKLFQTVISYVSNTYYAYEEEYRFLSLNSSYHARHPSRRGDRHINDLQPNKSKVEHLQNSAVSMLYLIKEIIYAMKSILNAG